MPIEFNMPPISAGFDPRAAFVVRRLRADFPAMQDFHAAAIVGNLGGESGLEAVQEKHPLAGAGGFGWEQATGPRRSAFYAFAAGHSLSVTDDEANYGFLVSELQTTEQTALAELLKATDLNGATLSFCLHFERPADPYGTLPSRVGWAEKALSAYKRGLDLDYPDPDHSAAALNAQELKDIQGRPIVGPVPTPPATDGGDSPVKAGHVVMGITGVTGALAIAIAYHLGLPDKVAQADAILLIFAFGALHVSGVPSALVAKFFGGTK